MKTLIFTLFACFTISAFAESSLPEDLTEGGVKCDFNLEGNVYTKKLVIRKGTKVRGEVILIFGEELVIQATIFPVFLHTPKLSNGPLIIKQSVSNNNTGEGKDLEHSIFPYHEELLIPGDSVFAKVYSFDGEKVGVNCYYYTE